MKNRKGRRGRGKAAACYEGAAAGNCDRLSKLPNDVLLNILERVETLDAIRTCILNKQMLKLPTMLSQLVIRIDSITKHHPKSKPFDIRDLVRMNGAVADITENILSARIPEIPIRKLNVTLVMMHYDFVSVCKSFARTMATHKVEAAELEILSEKNPDKCSPADFLYFAKQFNNFLGAFPDVFAGITRLWLNNMRFGELDIPNILSNCKRLESLRLSHCDAGIRSVLQLENDHLVELEIDYGNFLRVELTCLPKLHKVGYNTWLYEDHPLCFGFVPQLSKLRLTKTGIISDMNVQLSQFLANCPFISDLHLDFESEKIWVLPECPKLLAPVLGNLRLVNLNNLPEGCDIAWTMFILEAAPSLKELCITVWDHWCVMVTDKACRKANGYCSKANVEWKPSAFNLKHRNLAKFIIHGFQPDGNFMGYIRRVMEAAVNIEEISLHDRKVWECCGDLDPKIKVCPSRYPRTDDERKHIIEDLGMASPAVVHFWS